MPVGQHVSLYRAEAFLQGPLCCVHDGAEHPSQESLGPAVSPPPTVPLRQSQRRLKMAAQEEPEAGSQESAGDAFAR